MAANESTDLAFFVWPTAWGPMGAVAGPRGLLRVVLPGEYSAADLSQLLAWEHKPAARDESPFRDLVALARDYFNGRPADFSTVVCDLPKETTFGGRVYRACREIPYGRTESYSAMALRIGQPDSSRAVAAAMSKNSLPLVVPCHRVVYADGRPGGFSAQGGPQMKQRMLDMERRSVPSAGGAPR